mmetsp:Transcript_43034/g.133782  ORF Transcript_43034/g.133782 Transcript_43034/m.133782 type:complete len:248 (+) Transcript_43034:100-843(+)
MGTKLESAMVARESLAFERRGMCLPFLNTASWERQFRSMCSAAVLSLRSSFNRSLRSLRSWRLPFSASWCPTRSWCARRTVAWCSPIMVVTGSSMCSRVARCFLYEEQVVVMSMGSSSDLMCARVSAIVCRVWSIFPFVSRSSPSRRLRTCFASLMRSCNAFSVLAAASSAAFWQRVMRSLLSSRRTLADSSRLAADWFRRIASCWRFSSLRAVSCRAFGDLVDLSEPPDLPTGGEDVGRVACMIVW